MDLDCFDTIFPVGVEVSICSDRLTKSIPRAWNVSSARSKWDTLRAKRSNFETTAASNRRRLAPAKPIESYALLGVNVRHSHDTRWGHEH